LKTLKSSKCLATIAIIIFLGFFASVFGVGEVLSHHARRDIGAKPTDLPYESVSIAGAEKQVISGWQLRGKPGFGVVLLLHGVRADRREMLERSKFLNRLGYSVLLIDLPAHGLSSGEQITYGLKEAEGVKSALNHIKNEFPSEKIGVIGASLGAASFVLSKQGSMVSAVVLESMFPSIQDAVKDRLNLYLGPAGELLAPLLLWQLPLRINISPDQLRPIAEIPALHAPVLIMAGDLDKHTTLVETKSIFAAANEPKDLLIFEGAAHVDLHNFAPKVYENKVGNFLFKYLR
jgi:uncharacterized protein